MCKYTYDENGKQVTFKDSTGFGYNTTYPNGKPRLEFFNTNPL